MTSLHQERHKPIAAEDAENVKEWHLPFWTEHPVWVSEKKDYDKYLKARKPSVTPPSEPEIEPAVEAADQGDEIVEQPAVVLPTAEELETIRREAYNDGLEQGLVEGRQQGHREGYDAGHREAYDIAFAEGQTNGHAEGFRSGEELGLRKAQADINVVVSRLERVFTDIQSRIYERDKELPQVLANLVTLACEKVLGYELKNGSLNILTYIQRALAELPEGEENIQVFIGPDDERPLQKALSETGLEMHYKVDASLPAGICRVENKHSLAEYSSHEYLNTVLSSLLEQLTANAADYPTKAEMNIWEIAEEHRKKQIIEKAEAALAAQQQEAELEHAEEAAADIEHEDNGMTAQAADSDLILDSAHELEYQEPALLADIPLDVATGSDDLSVQNQDADLNHSSLSEHDSNQDLPHEPQ